MHCNNQSTAAPPRRRATSTCNHVRHAEELTLRRSSSNAPDETGRRLPIPYDRRSSRWYLQARRHIAKEPAAQQRRVVRRCGRRHGLQKCVATCVAIEQTQTLTKLVGHVAAVMYKLWGYGTHVTLMSHPNSGLAKLGGKGTGIWVSSLWRLSAASNMFVVRQLGRAQSRAWRTLGATDALRGDLRHDDHGAGDDVPPTQVQLARQRRRVVLVDHEQVVAPAQESF